MKKMFFLLTASLSILTSCSSDSDIDNKKILFLKNITQYVKISSNNESTLKKIKSIDFVYDGNKIVSETIERYADDKNYFFEKKVYKYTGDLISKIEYTVGRIDNQTYQTISSFNIEMIYENNKLKSALRSSDTYSGIKDVYSYNSNGTISLDVFAVFPGSDNLTDQKEISIDSKGNIIKLDSNDSTLKISYDNKSNPLKNVLGYSKLLIDLSFEGELPLTDTTNNVININKLDKKGNDNYFINFENSYNSDDYLIKSLCPYYTLEYTYY